MSGGRAMSPTPGGDPVRAPVALVYSSHAGSAERANPEELLRDAGLDVVDTLPITQLATLSATRLAARWRNAGALAVVAAGGDGSVGAVAALAGQADLPLGILPLGTSNDIARALALPEDLAAAARFIAHALASGEERLIDAGELVSIPEAPDDLNGAGFLHALTLGLNVEFARLATDVEQRQRWGKLTYAASALESLSHFTPIPVTLTIEGMEGQPEGVTQTISANLTLLAAINLPVFGGWLGLRLPTVLENDRLLDFILIDAPALPDLVNLAAALGNFLVALTGGERETTPPEIGALPGGRWFRARSVTITTPDPVEITLDGELRGHTPAIARVAERPARVLAPHRQVAPRATLEVDSNETTTDVGERSSGTM